MVSAPPRQQATVDTLGRGIEHLPTEDVPRGRIEQLMGSINGQLYFFERLNLSKNYLDHVSSKAEFLELAFQGNPVKGRDSVWRLSLESVEQIESEEIFLIGYLVKQDKNFNELAKARFFLEVESGLIAYHLVQNEINDKQFRQYLCQVIEDTAINFSINIAASVCPLDKSSNYLLEAISQLEILSKVEIYLSPSNPSTRRYWRNIDTRLHELEVAKSQETLEANPGQSLNSFGLLGDDLFIEKVLMASDGYGLVRIEGTKPKPLYYEEEEPERFGDLILSTGDQPIVTRVEEDGEEPLAILSVLLAFFRELKKTDDE